MNEVKAPAEPFDLKRNFIERAQVLSGRKCAEAHLIGREVVQDGKVIQLEKVEKVRIK